MLKTLHRLTVVEKELRRLSQEKRRLLRQVVAEEPSPEIAQGLQDQIIALAKERLEVRPIELKEELKKEWPFVTTKRISACLSRLCRAGILVRESRALYKWSENENV